MKIALDCEDLLLKSALELFLKEHLVLRKDCDFLITNSLQNISKPQFIIGEQGCLKLPFAKSELISKLELFNQGLQTTAKKILEEREKELLSKIDSLIHGFRVKAYENIDVLISSMKKDLQSMFEN